MSETETTTGDGEGNERGDGRQSPFRLVTDTVLTATAQTLSAQRRFQRAGIEGYRQTSHVAAGVVGGVTAEESGSDLHDSIDEQCDALQEAVSDTWRTYESLVDETGALVETLTDTEQVASAGRPIEVESKAQAETSDDDAAAETRGDTGSTTGETATEPSVEADLEDVEGIGPTYAERLRAAGIESVAALAAADASLGEEVEGRGVDVEDWIERAQRMVEGS